MLRRRPRLSCEVPRCRTSWLHGRRRTAAPSSMTASWRASARCLTAGLTLSAHALFAVTGERGLRSLTCSSCVR